MSDLPIVAEVTPPPDVVVDVTPLPDIVAEVGAMYGPAGARPHDTRTVLFVYVSQSYGDPLLTPVPLQPGTPAYFFSATEEGSTDPTPWEFAGLYDGHSEDGVTPEPLTLSAIQPYDGSFYLSRGFVDLTGNPPSGPPLLDDSPRPRIGYVSPNNGVDAPIFILLAERPQPANGNAIVEVGTSAAELVAEVTTAADWPEITEDYKGNPIADGGYVYFQEMLDALAARAGGTGDVVGPASATDNSLARYDGTTGKLLKDGAVIGTDVQAYNANLATIAGLTATTDNFIQAKSSAWASRTPAQVAADLPKGLRRIVIYPAAEPPTTLSGSHTPAASSSSVTGGYANTGAAVGDTSWTYADLPLEAGTWEIRFIARQNSGLGIITASLAGVSGTVDTYNAAATFNNNIAITGLTIPTTGFGSLVITNPTKNASSSGYSLSIQAIIMRRTGA